MLRGCLPGGLLGVKERLYHLTELLFYHQLVLLLERQRHRFIVFALFSSCFVFVLFFKYLNIIIR